MATISKVTPSQKNMGQGEACVTGVGSPITNAAYNVVSALHAKLEGLEAYRKYANDGNAEVWQRLCAEEVRGVQVLCDELERLVGAGEFRLREPGRANA